MEILNDLELATELNKWLRQRVDELNRPARSAGIHLTELIYCLTRGFYERINPIPRTDKDNILLGLGIALERLLIPIEQRVSAGTKDGIDYSPDFYFKDNEPAELKTTRMSTKKTLTREFPETWLQQIKGYCYCAGKLIYRLGVLHLLGDYHPPFPEILAVRFIFTEQELKDNWNYLLNRKSIYIKAFVDGIPPEPRRWCQKWECSTCQYIERCGVK